MTPQEWLILAQETVKSVIKNIDNDTLYENRRKLGMVVKYIEEAKEPAK